MLADEVDPLTELAYDFLDPSERQEFQKISETLEEQNLKRKLAQWEAEHGRPASKRGRFAQRAAAKAKAQAAAKPKAKAAGSARCLSQRAV